MVLEVVDGYYTGRKIYNNYFLSVKTAEASIKRIYKMAELAGIQPKAFTDVDSIVDFCNGFLDKCFTVAYDENAFHKVSVIEAL